MKKLLLSIVALCAAISVYSQSVKSIRINGHDKQQKYVSISDIDSITYDVYSQHQTLWSQGNAAPFSLSDIESVSFENNEVTYSYVENFIDSIDAVFTKDGYVALFGVQKTEGENISELYNRMITISKVDYETGAIDETQNLAILVDSLNNPTVIAAGDYTYFISNLTGNTFDCIIMSEDGSWEYKNIPYSYTPNDANSRKFAVRRANGDIASSPVPPFSLGDLTNSIGMGNALGTAITATTNGERVSAGLGIVGSFAGIFNGEAGLLLSGLSDAVVKALGGTALAVAGYLWDWNYKFILEHIGPWYIGIQSIEQTGRKSCTIKYSIDGIKSVKDGNPVVKLFCFKSDKDGHDGKGMERTVQLGKAENGFHEFTIENLESGYYKIYMSVIDDCHRAMNIRITTNPEILVRMFDIGLDRYEVQDNPSYLNGTVNFKMDVFLKGSEEGLGDDVQQFGYYTRYSNAIPDYKQVTYFSSIFESTPLTYELPIEREGFFEENKNYSTFEAKATGYYIGAYIVLKNGNIVTIDEQEIEGLIYKQKPSLTFTSASMGGVSTQTYQDDEGNEYLHYSVPYWFDFNVEGAFWIDYVQYTIYGDGWTYDGGNPIIVYDGPYSYESSMGYYQGSDLNTIDFYTITLTNGSTMRSANSMIFGGADANPTISVGGAPSFARPMRTTQRSQSNINRVCTKTGIGIVSKE